MVVNVLHMNAGDGETSYFHNSTVQKTVISKARHVLEDTIEDLCGGAIPCCFKVADLGCSTGPNTLSVISEIIDTVLRSCRKMKHNSPEFQVFLNDLPENDFNCIFKSLPSFYKEMKREKGDEMGPCSIAGLPGSFYERLFPGNSLDVVHSSYSVHWLSQVPVGLEINKSNIYMAKTSPQGVFEAYMQQFQMDFSLFLQLRAKEIITQGRMVLTFLGRKVADPSSRDCCKIWELLAKSLLDVATERHVEEVQVDSFNLPYYTPCEEEVRTVIENEGSFVLDKLELFEVNWDGTDDSEGFTFNRHDSGRRVANIIRAGTEPMIASHFGEYIVDELFAKFANNVAEHLSRENTKHVNIVISMTKK